MTGKKRTLAKRGASDKTEEFSRDRIRLLSQLQKGQTKSLKSKVIHVLADDPSTRDCDRLLVRRLFQRFYPSKIVDDRIHLDDLDQLPKAYDIQRYRAHIQNSLGLFRASPEIREQRARMRSKKEVEFSEFSTEKALFIYCDESGLASNYTVVGSFCRGQVSGEPLFPLDEVHAQFGEDKEFKFSKVRKQSLDTYSRFLTSVLATTAPWSVHALWLENQRAASRSQEDRVWAMLRLLAGEVILRQVQTQRFSPPFKVYFLKDSDSGQDELRLKDLQRELLADIGQHSKTTGVTLELLRAEDSKETPGIQVADLITGSFSRIKNQPDGDGLKDRFATEVLKKIGYLPAGRNHDRVSFIDFLTADPLANDKKRKRKR